MDNQPLVSIIMNCYNGEEYLAESLESIQAQTYHNWELIFWDNQSIDNSSTIIKSFKDPRFRYFYASEHRKLYDARGLAIQESKGDLIAFLDTDDTWEPNKLNLQIPLFNNSSVALVYGNYWIYDQKSKKKKLIYSQSLPSGKIVRFLLTRYVVGLLTVMFRKDAYEKLDKQFDPQFPLIGDFDFVIRLSYYYNFLAIQEPIASYRWHGKNNSYLFLQQQINELEQWYDQMSFNQEFSNFKELLSVKNNINYLKGKKNAEDKKYILSLKYFFLLPYCFNKIKLLIIIIMPKLVVKHFSRLSN